MAEMPSPALSFARVTDTPLCAATHEEVPGVGQGRVNEKQGNYPSVLWHSLAGELLDKHCPAPSSGSCCSAGLLAREGKGTHERNRYQNPPDHVGAQRVTDTAVTENGAMHSVE